MIVIRNDMGELFGFGDHSVIYSDCDFESNGVISNFALMIDEVVIMTGVEEKISYLLSYIAMQIGAHPNARHLLIDLQKGLQTLKLSPGEV